MLFVVIAFCLLVGLAFGIALCRAAASADDAVALSTGEEALTTARQESRQRDGQLAQAAHNIGARDAVPRGPEQAGVERAHQLDAPVLQLDQHRAHRVASGRRCERSEIGIRLQPAEGWRGLRGSVSAAGVRWRDHARLDYRPGRQAWRLAVALSLLIAGCDALLGHRVILLALLSLVPLCALFTGRWMRTALVGVWAIALGVPLGVPDGIWGTRADVAMLAIVLGASVLSTLVAAMLERRTVG